MENKVLKALERHLTEKELLLVDISWKLVWKTLHDNGVMAATDEKAEQLKCSIVEYLIKSRK